ncbi:hypothetical protein V8E54_012649 [Elaphomyces granulatus]
MCWAYNISHDELSGFYTDACFKSNKLANAPALTRRINESPVLWLPRRQHVNFEVLLMLFDVISYINSLCRNLAYSSKKILEWFKIDEGNLTSSFGGLWATKNKNAGEIVCLLDAIDKHTEGLGSPRPY